MVHLAMAITGIILNIICLRKFKVVSLVIPSNGLDAIAVKPMMAMVPAGLFLL